jgi:hypothetical protein
MSMAEQSRAQQPAFSSSVAPRKTEGRRPIFFALALVLTGCLTTGDEGASVAAGASELVIENALTPNALTPNALTPNALTPNALTPNALTPNALTPNALASLNDTAIAGDLSRLLMKYVVGCAFGEDQVFSFSWTDAAGIAHAESYPGHLELAPNWASGPLDAQGQQMVSACLAARINWYGVHVMLSIRSPTDPLRTKVKNAELDAYPNIEGAFWGNVFSTSPTLHACYDGTNTAYAHAHQRDCTAGHVDAQGVTTECGIIDVVGDCASACKGLHPTGKYYKSCQDPVSGKTAFVITTALQ